MMKTAVTRRWHQVKKENVLYMVIPCYKEEAVLPETARRLRAKMTALIEEGKIAGNSRVLFVNDGSSDRTWALIEELHGQDPLFSGVNLSRNRGHQNAVLAGLMTAVQYADMMISMDADLQDDVDAIDKMVDAYHAGNDVVYGVRARRDTDTFFKRLTAESFYRLLKMMGVEIVFNHDDFRLMSRRAVEGLAQFKEVNLFLRGIVPQIGFPWTTVSYDRAERFAGESKYPLKKMLALAFDGVTSFSVKPLRLIVGCGVVALAAALVLLIWALCAGSGSLAGVGSLWLLGGVQLTALGVVGEYVGKVYGETKARPRFIIERVINDP